MFPSYSSIILFLGLWLFGQPSNIQAEELPSYSIVNLSVYAEQLVEAVFLKRVDDRYFFLAEDLMNEESKADTIIIHNIQQLYHSPKDNQVGVENSDRLIIYLSSNEPTKAVPVISGYRIHKGGKIYSPWQVVNPGGYYFNAHRDTLSWEGLKKRAIRVHKRISALKALRDIAAPQQKNERLFEWLERHKETMGKNCDFDEDCSWGMLETEIFRWIIQSRIAADTWKASQLFREISAQSEIDWQRARAKRALIEQDKTAFDTYDKVQFLVSTAIDTSQAIADRRQALVFLQKACRIVYKDNDPLRDSTLLGFQVEKQKEMRQAIFDLIAHDELKSEAFEVVMTLSNPLRHGLRHRIDLDHLPLIIQRYHKESDLLFKNTLANFIAHNTTTEAWKVLTNCDAGIFISLYHIRVDTARQQLSFAIYYKHGIPEINKTPDVYIHPIANPSPPIILPWTALRLPYQNSSGSKRFKTDISELSKGTYRVYVKGQAGERNQYKWISAEGKFVIN